MKGLKKVSFKQYLSLVNVLLLFCTYIFLSVPMLLQAQTVDEKQAQLDALFRLTDQTLADLDAANEALEQPEEEAELAAIKEEEARAILDATNREIDREQSER